MTTAAAEPAAAQGATSGPGATGTVAELLLAYLKNEGVRAVFGLPGGPLSPLFDALYHEPSIRTISARHEGGAAFMALGYARVSGRLGTCFVTTGPGATNAITGVAAAQADCLPLLAVTAQVATATFGRGSIQDSYDRLDLVGMLKSITKMSVMVAHPHNFTMTIRQAIRQTMSGRRGPAHVNLPTDFMKRRVPWELTPPRAYRPVSRPFDRDAVRQAAAELSSARKPAILAGNGVNLGDARAELLELAEYFGIPVATTPKGKGAFPENHPLALRVFGTASSPWSEKVLLEEEVDVLFVIGSSLHESSTQGWESRLAPSRCLLHLDIEPSVLGRNYPVGVPLVGDIKTTLRELLFQLRRLPERGGAPDEERLRRLKRETPPLLDEEAACSNAVPIRPQRLMRALNDALPDDAIIFLDSGNNTLWGTHYLNASGRNVFVHNWGDFGAMGFGVAAAIGGKVAAPERAVVAIVGDGAFAMNGMEVATAVAYGIPVVWVVLNDSRLNAVHHGQSLLYEGRTIGCDFPRMDLAKVAQGLGADGLRVVEPAAIAPALRAALASGRPTVLDVWIDADEVPPIHSRIRSIQKFFAGMAS